jgi:hypothetical protein
MFSYFHTDPYLVVERPHIPKPYVVCVPPSVMFNNNNNNGVLNEIKRIQVLSTTLTDINLKTK